MNNQMVVTTLPYNFPYIALIYFDENALIDKNLHQRSSQCYKIYQQWSPRLRHTLSLYLPLDHKKNQQCNA